MISYNLTYSGYTSQDTRQAPDIVLEGGRDSATGATQKLMFFSGRPIAEYDVSGLLEARLEPRYWVTEGRNPVTRDKLMVVLDTLQAVYIKGSFGPDTGSSLARLEGVMMDSGAEVEDGEVVEPVPAVEQCECPPGYSGLSCQLCSPGYFTTRRDKWGPVCEPCQCHGHADSCHPTTGECVRLVPPAWVPDPTTLPCPETSDEGSGSGGSTDCNDPEWTLQTGSLTLHYCHYNPKDCTVDPKEYCEDNTMGEHCELCMPGYYGDATRGTTDSCLACPCPLPENK